MGPAVATPADATTTVEPGAGAREPGAGASKRKQGRVRGGVRRVPLPGARPQSGASGSWACPLLLLIGTESIASTTGQALVRASQRGARAGLDSACIYYY